MGLEVDLLVYVSTGEETNGTHVELVGKHSIFYDCYDPLTQKEAKFKTSLF